jgi:hypothetical protein
MVLSHSGASKRVGKRWNGFFVSIRYLCCFIEGRIMKKYGVDRDKESCKLLQAMPEEGFRLLFGR